MRSIEAMASQPGQSKPVPLCEALAHCSCPLHVAPSAAHHNSITFVTLTHTYSHALTHSCPALDGAQLEDEGGDGSAGSHWWVQAIHVLGCRGLPSELQVSWTL